MGGLPRIFAKPTAAPGLRVQRPPLSGHPHGGRNPTKHQDCKAAAVLGAKPRLESHREERVVQSAGRGSDQLRRELQTRNFGTAWHP